MHTSLCFITGRYLGFRQYEGLTFIDIEYQREIPNYETSPKKVSLLYTGNKINADVGDNVELYGSLNVKDGRMQPLIYRMQVYQKAKSNYLTRKSMPENNKNIQPGISGPGEYIKPLNLSVDDIKW